MTPSGVATIRPTAHTSFALRIDALALVMMLVVTATGFLIHLYATRFMAESEGYRRFFSFMNLFVASMLVLVLADNLLLLYLGWEGVGLCSYLLIGFWWRDPENGRAARKAFIVTRIGDVSLAVGLFVIFFSLGTLDVPEVARRAAAQWPVGSGMAIAAAALILGGAVGKSAQLPLHTWLPDAMAGPSPVSALIHAATMVTAGVYLIARTNALFLLAPPVMLAVAVVGVAGALVAGTSAAAQHDLKRVLAYSTMSQIGYMFLALGVGAWSGAIFHLTTHAFFKSLLFLSGGVVIQALNEEHDIFAMGGMARKMPLVFWTFLAGIMALTALPPITAGFASKDLILAATWISPVDGQILWALALAGVFVTSVYSFRLLFIVFLGKPREREIEPGYRVGGAMGVPLVILALLCLVGGLLGLPRTIGGKQFLVDFLQSVLPVGAEPGIRQEATLELESLVASLLGLPVAWLLYRRSLVPPVAAAMRASLGGFRRFFLFGWGFDWIYDHLLVRPVAGIAEANRADLVYALPDGVGGFSMFLSTLFRYSQNGKVRWYAVGFAAGAALAVAAVVLL